jgi:hypothetical protein
MAPPASAAALSGARALSPRRASARQPVASLNNAPPASALSMSRQTFPAALSGGRATSPCRASARQPVASPPLHSTSAASRHPALRLARIQSVCSLVAPGLPSAALVSVQRGGDTTGCRRGKLRLRRARCRCPLQARAIQEPVPNQLDSRVKRASVANQRLRGQKRLRRIFALTLSRWPHRAGRPTWLVRHAPRCSPLLAQGRRAGAGQPEDLGARRYAAQPESGRSESSRRVRSL